VLPSSGDNAVMPEEPTPPFEMHLANPYLARLRTQILGQGAVNKAPSLLSPEAAKEKYLHPAVAWEVQRLDAANHIKVDAKATLLIGEKIGKFAFDAQKTPLDPRLRAQYTEMYIMAVPIGLRRIYETKDHPALLDEKLVAAWIDTYQPAMCIPFIPF